MKKILTIILGMIFLVGIVNASYWVNDPNNCPTSALSQTCSGNDVECGQNNGILYCYDPASLSPPTSSTTTQTTSWSASYDGGYLLDCEAYDGTSPHCDNNGAMWCDRDSTCYNVHRITQCEANKWSGDTDDTSCTTCISGYEYCDGSYTDADGCEVHIGVTNCNAGANNNIDGSCNCVCDSGYLDCDASGAGAGNGCEVQDGGSCTVGSLSGTYNGCTCKVDKSYYETGTLTEYLINAVDGAMLWFKNYGNGSTINATDKNDVSFIVNETGVYWNNSKLGSGSGSYTETDPYWTDNFTSYNESWSKDTTYSHLSNFTNDLGFYNSTTINSSELENQGDGKLGILDSFINLLIDNRVTQSFIQALSFYTKSEVDTNITNANDSMTSYVNSKFFSDIVNFTGTLTDTKYCTYDSANNQIVCDSEGGASQTYYDGTGIEINASNNINIKLAYQMPQGCNDGEIAEYNTTSGGWDCAIDNSAASGMSNWVLAASDTSGSETITDGETVTIADDNAYLNITRVTNTITISLYENKLNETIDARDSDTTYTAGTGLILTSTTFSINTTYLDDNYIGQNEYPNLDTDTSDDFDGAWSSLTGVPSGFSDDVDNDTQLTESQVDAYVDNNNYLDMDTYPNADTDSTNDITTTNIANQNVNSSNYWDGLNTPGDIGTSELNNDAGFITNSTMNKTVSCSDIIGGPDTDFCTDDNTGSGGSSKWIDGGDYIYNNNSFADNVNVTGNLTVGSGETTFEMYNNGSTIIFDTKGNNSVFTDNVTADYFIGDGSQLTGIASATDTNCSVDGSCSNIVYDSDTTNWDKDTSDDFSGSWNDLTNMPSDFADGVDNDTDTTYTAGSNLSLVGTEFSLDATGVRNWLDNVYVQISNIVSLVGNWSADKDNYYTKSEIDSQGYITSESDPLWTGNSTLVVYTSDTTNWDKDTSDDLTSLTAGSNITISGTGNSRTIAVDTTSLKTWLDTIYQAIGNYLTTSTSFGGDVSGTYDNLQVADDSHLLNCANITGATSDLCTVTDTDTQLSEAQVEGMIFDNDNTGNLDTTGNLNTSNGNIYLSQNKFVCLNQDCTSNMTYNGTHTIWY